MKNIDVIKSMTIEELAKFLIPGEETCDTCKHGG